jgi:hypothetical protein
MLFLKEFDRMITLESDTSENKTSLKSETYFTLDNGIFVKALTFTESNMYFDVKKIKYKYFLEIC